MEKNGILAYRDPSDPSRFVRIMDDGEKVYCEASIPVEEGALRFFEALADLVNRNEGQILTKLRAYI